MLDIKFIRKNRDLIKKVVKDKGCNLDIDKLLDLDEKRRKSLTKIEEFRAKKNKASKEIVSLKDEKKKEKIISEMRKIDKEADKVEEEFKRIDKEYKKLMALVPNVYSEDTPVGFDETVNKEIYRWGEIPYFDFPPKSHIQIGKELDLIDIERGVKTSGFRGYYLKNEAVLIQIGLIQLALEKLRKKGFTLMIPPTILREFALFGAGFFPEGKNEVYQIANPGRLADGKKIKEKLFLAGTSEPSLLAYWADTILEEKELPIKVAGFSQCYRSEVGSYGKDTKGLYRLHEFMKVEQVILCRADLNEAHRFFKELSENAQELLRELKLPYRVMKICTGEMGTGKYEMEDIEVWMPSYNSYRETHSNSNLTDWQARRLNIRYRKQDRSKNFVYTLNNTMIASPRILIAILENYQQKDGSVRVPEILQDYLKTKVIKR
ncbi:serine--tRNA ligase [bacterium]|nr:serine--tRNA ligase [bacterium]